MNLIIVIRHDNYYSDNEKENQSCLAYSTSYGIKICKSIST